MVAEEFYVPVRIGLSACPGTCNDIAAHYIFPIVSGPWAFKLSPRLFEVPIIRAVFFNSLPWSLTLFSNFLQVTPESKLFKTLQQPRWILPTSSFRSRSSMVSGSTLHTWSSASLMEAFSSFWFWRWPTLEPRLWLKDYQKLWNVINWMFGFPPSKHRGLPLFSSR